MTHSAVSWDGMFKRVNSIPEHTVVEAQDMRGYLNQDELKQIEDTRSSWKTTGCSVLVDGWRDVKGRDLINVFVDCPLGPIYLRSLDISAAMEDYDVLLLVFDEIIEEVGPDNVVQIISNYTSPCMKIVGKLFMEKHPTIFWTVSSSCCIELMLEKMGTMDLIERILNKARMLMNFIYSRRAVLILMRSVTRSNDLVKSTKIRSIMPFLTLENIVSKKKNLQQMFSSSEWRSSALASKVDGKRIADLVGDASFWSDANVVLKATIPLVNALRLIHESLHPQLGYIYETMDQIKESIKNGFDKDKGQYMPYWEVIDEVWENCLHSPLHSAAYYLNPQYRYSADFCTDAEVYTGLFFCICNMIEEKKLERLIVSQFELYATEMGPFGRKDAIQRSSSISPVRWWFSYGNQCPELRDFAVKILSQTCDGASKYHLNRGWAEKLLTEERNPTAQQKLKDQTYAEYNSKLQQF